jgi:hypothetical protein
MPELELKPLNWEPTPGIGYTVTRRPDGGMHYVFTDVSTPTIKHWRAFALDHLLNADRMTRNLYDVRLVPEISEEAIQYAVEVNSDPLTRSIRLAVVVANEQVLQALMEIEALTTPGGVELGIFTDMTEAEDWLDRPLTLIV